MQETRNKINSLLEESYAIRINDLEKSISLTNTALLLCITPNFNDLKAKSLSQLSLYYMITGKYDESYNLSQKCNSLYEKLNDEKGIADSKYNIAGFYYRTNNFQLGVVYLIDALIIYKKHKDYHNISRCEKSLGTIYGFTGDDVKAIQSHKNAIKAAKKINDLNLESNAYNNLSGIYIKNNQIDLALEIIEKSISIKLKTKDTRGLAFAIYGRGKVFFKQKEFLEAENDFIESIEIHSKMGERLGLGMAYNKLAKLYFETNRVEKARISITKGLEICNLYNISLIKIKSLYLMYSIFKFENNGEQALHYLELYLFEKENIFNAQNFKIIENYDLLVRMKAMQKETEFQQEKNLLIAKSNKIEEAARVRQEFLSTMSHEIRTPLNAVTTIASMLSENSHIDDKMLIDSLTFSSNHLMQIINDILDFTKLDLGKMHLDFQSIHFKLYIENFWKTHQYQAQQKGIDFKLELDENLNDFYSIDATKITQILGNLVTNAVKFTDEGTVLLAIKLVQSLEEYDLILFNVTDTGIGIEKENLDQVFESFSQLKNGINRQKDGTGLGLSISKKIIELHNSEIKIKSVYGKGSTFSFELKIKKTKNTILYKKSTINHSIIGTKVLLAEDNAINAMIAKKLLSKWEIETDHAVDGLIAIEKCKLNKYDYILMDIHMPVLDGYEAAKNIRTIENLNKETPIFGLSADISAKENSEYNHYFDDFFLKPLEIEKLKAALSFK